jgi:hypothetical protein
MISYVSYELKGIINGAKLTNGIPELLFALSSHSGHVLLISLDIIIIVMLDQFAVSNEVVPVSEDLAIIVESEFLLHTLAFLNLEHKDSGIMIKKPLLIGLERDTTTL